MPTRLPRAQRRRQILDAAIEEFAQHGFRGTTTRRLASAAGVSEATLYLHFPTKRALYRAILQDKVRGEDSVLAELTAGETRPLRDTLLRVASAALRRHKRHRTLLRLLLYSALEDHELARDFFRQQMKGPFRQLICMLRACQERGELDRDVDVEVAARAFVGLVHNEILWRELVGGALAPRLSVERVVDGYVEIYLHGVAEGG